MKKHNLKAVRRSKKAQAKRHGLSKKQKNVRTNQGVQKGKQEPKKKRLQSGYGTKKEQPFGQQKQQFGKNVKTSPHGQQKQHFKKNIEKPKPVFQGTAENLENKVGDGEGKKEHSVKVPQLYKEASRILKRYDNKEGSLKTLVYAGRYREYRVMYGLLSKLIDNRATVKTAIAVSNLLDEQPRFDPHLAELFTTQLMVKGLTGNCKPIVIFKEYEDKIKEAAKNNFQLIDDKKLKECLPRYVRVNTLLGGMDRVCNQLADDGFILDNYDSSDKSYDDFLERVKNLTAPYYLIDYHIPDLLVFPPNTPFYDSVLYKNSVAILQDKASCLPVFLSGVEERCNVIDACAAPGNKTSYIAAKIKNKGKIIAVERLPDRFKTMKKLLNNRQARCVTALNQDFSNLNPSDYCNFEYIFVDPSCSSSGMKPHKDEVSRQRVTGLAKVQLMLLSHALSFPAVKEVIYSTCSVNEEENEAVVEDALMNYGTEFELADLGPQLPGWKHFGLPRYEFGSCCLRTDVKTDRCTGFFVAKFVRKNESKLEENTKKRKSEMEADEDCQEGKGKRGKILNEEDIDLT